jgi:hypothetical protein
MPFLARHYQQLLSLTFQIRLEGRVIIAIPFLFQEIVLLSTKGLQTRLLCKEEEFDERNF